MRIFLTGATGFIGSAIVPELIQAGHQVLGFTRSDAGAKALTAAGAEVHRGELSDLDRLRSGADKSDGVIHTAFVHDFANFAQSCETDKRAIEVLGSALEGSDRPLLVSAGLGLLAPGRPATERDMPPPPGPTSMPRVSEETAASFEKRGVGVTVVRLSQIHDPVKQGLVSYLIAHARQTGLSAYVGEGQNRWAAAHVSDTAHLYRLALEKRETGARYHAVAEEGVTLKAIAEAIGKGLKIPVVSKSGADAEAHFGWLVRFAGMDISASSSETQEKLGWHPSGPGLLSDLEKMDYSAS